MNNSQISKQRTAVPTNPPPLQVIQQIEIEFGYHVGYPSFTKTCSPFQWNQCRRTSVMVYNSSVIVHALLQSGGMSTFTSVHTTMRCTTYSASLITCFRLCATHVMWTPSACTSTMWEVLTGLKAQCTIMLAVLPHPHTCAATSYYC